MARRLIAAIILVAYSAALVRVLVFKNLLVHIGPLRFRIVQETGPANLVPFKTISSYLLDGRMGLITIVNLVGNVALFAPIGCLVPLAYRRMTWPGAIALGIAAGFAIEGLEAAFQTGVFDVDDLILNALGVVLGYGVFSIFVKPARPRPEPT